MNQYTVPMPYSMGDPANSHNVGVEVVVTDQFGAAANMVHCYTSTLT